MKEALEGKKILITGGSSGLGLALGRELALNRKAEVVLVARRGEALEAACRKVREEGGQAGFLVADLSLPQGRRLVSDWVRDEGVWGVVGNAGLTFYGASTEEAWQELKTVLEVNLVANMELFLQARNHLEARKGVFCFVSSLGGRIPIAYQGVYSASKHALEAFALACRAEQRGRGPRIQIFAPGGIDSPMYHGSGLSRKLGEKNPFNASAEATARALATCLERGKPYAVPGWLNRLTVRLSRLCPPLLLARLTERLYRPPAE